MELNRPVSKKADTVDTVEKAKPADILKPVSLTEHKIDVAQISAPPVQAGKDITAPGESVGITGVGRLVAVEKGGGEGMVPRPVEQLLSHIQANLTGPNQRITLTLTPPELGTIRITFQQQGQEVTGLLEVQKPEVRRDMEQAVGQLMTAMNQAGVQVRRIEVVNFTPGQNGHSGYDQQKTDFGNYDRPADGQGWAGDPQGSTGKQNGRTPLPQLTEDVMRQWVTEESLNMYI